MFTVIRSNSTRAVIQAVVALLLASGLLAPRPASAAVEWRNGARSAPSRMQPVEMRRAFQQLAARPDQTRVVVHFDGPLSRSRRDALEASGIRLLNYLGGFAYFAGLGDGLDTARAGSVAGLVAVEPIEPSNKLHPDLLRGHVHPWQRVGAPPNGDATTQSAKDDPLVAVYVLFHRDADFTRQAAGIVARHGGRIHSRIRSLNGAVVHLPMSRVAGLGVEDAVMWVEPPLPQFTGFNDSNRTRVGANTLQEAPYGLDGSGVSVMVYDGGRVFTHNDLAGRLTIGDSTSLSDHATHVACTIGGDGGTGNLRGMAPGTEIVSFGFEQEGGLHEGFLYTDPGDLEADYTGAITLHGADIANNSIGTNTASNGFPCEWEGNYGVTSALIDEIVRGSIDGNPFRIVWANGNERSTGNCGSTYHTTAPPACAKNHITVGALNSDNDSVTSFTSWGPADDGRLKPDISGPGCQSSGDFGVSSCSSSGGYTVKCGTSMSSPTIAGVAALLLQQYRQSFPAQPDPRNSTLKVILAQTAEDLGNAGPDYKVGYGSVRAVPATDLIIEERFQESSIEQGETYTALVLVESGTPELKATLAWDDPAGTPDVNPVLVNDLDLRIIAPDDTLHFPWTLDPDNPSAPAVQTQRDAVNNIEQVAISNPPPGLYRIEVEGFNIAEGPTQSFSLAASTHLATCSPDGVLSTERSRVACSAQLNMRVIDCDLNGNNNQAETVAVTVVSGSEPGGEMATLTETETASAVFEGSIPTDTIDSPGVLKVAHGETVTVTYIDADDGAGGINVPVTQDVIVDCVPPSTTGVTVLEVNPRDATLEITTDEPVWLNLPYGTVCGLLAGTSSSGTDLSASHQVSLTELTEETAYFFKVKIEDEAGNVSTDDNGGACYTFTTPEIQEFHTEEFGTGIDLEGLSITFTPDGSPDSYHSCVEPLAGVLPTDPSGGTDLELGDDLPVSVPLDNGATVDLFGQSYATVHVGPNGYLTFGAGDQDYDESLAEHFGLPRVSVLYDDLNAGQGGAVTWKQLADRIAVTWEDVPEHAEFNHNTFQVEMFFDGTIRLSWLQLDSEDAIVGLSEGLGLPPEFLESDLSGVGECGPFPPEAQDIGAQTTINNPVEIVLAATDDGQPQPPSLTYRITGLPTSGSLTDTGTGAAIAMVPYDLDPAGNSVTYLPDPGYSGQDGFTYLADDGGVPPTGGVSEIATVIVTVTVGAPQVLHEFLADDSDPGWISTGDWAFGQPAGGGSHDGDPTSGATGNHVFGYNLGGDYADNMGEEYLTSPPLNLSFAEETVLEFRRWLGVDASSGDHAKLQISTDGTSWASVWNHMGAAISEDSWSLQSYDISAVADHQAAVRLRWVMGSTDGSVTYPGWNIDDIRVIGVVHPNCSEPPQEVENLRMTADGQTMQWTAGIQFGSDPPVYDTLRSTGPQEFDGTVVCIETDDGSDTQATDTEDPAPGVVFHYLVRAENGCGLGSFGQDSSGEERQGQDCAAP